MDFPFLGGFGLTATPRLHRSPPLRFPSATENEPGCAVAGNPKTNGAQHAQWLKRPCPRSNHTGTQAGSLPPSRKRGPPTGRAGWATSRACPNPPDWPSKWHFTKEQERRALEGELWILEQAWKEAEEIGAIVDSLLLPVGSDASFDRYGQDG